MSATQRRFVSALGVGLLLATASANAEKVIVKMRSPSQFRALHDSFRSALRDSLRERDVFGHRVMRLPSIKGTVSRVLNSFDQLNMVVVDVNSPAELAALRANPEVQMAEAEIMYPAPRVPLARRQASEGNPGAGKVMPWGIKAVHAPEAWDAGSRGQGTKVVILDTGIDRDHPDLKNQIALARNFFTKKMELPEDEEAPNFLTSPFQPVKFADREWGPSSEPAYDYYDQIGHGTHVAGTIAAEDRDSGVVGVAPEAKLLIGRVCGKFGCSSVAIVDGVNWAIKQGADVISMSLGGPMDSKAQREALAASENAGLVNVAATGNDGTAEVSFPAAYPSVLAVGAVDSTLTRAKFSQYGPETGIVAPGVDVMSSVPLGSGRAAKVEVKVKGKVQEVRSTSFVGSPEVDSPLKGRLVAAGLGKPEDFSQASKGNIALIKRGEIPFTEKVKNAIEAGASAVIVYNHEEGLISGGLTQDGSVVAIPVVMIEKDVGEALVSSLGEGNKEQALLQTMRTDYAAFQGTSMATPHVAGVAALVRSANKRLTPKQVREVLKSTATPHPTDKNEYGAGVVNAESAVRTAMRM